MLTEVRNNVTYSQPCLYKANDPALPLDFDMLTKPSSPLDIKEEPGPITGEESAALTSFTSGGGAGVSGMTVGRGSLGIVIVRRNLEGSMPLELLRNLRSMMLPTRN